MQQLHRNWAVRFPLSLTSVEEGVEEGGASGIGADANYFLPFALSGHFSNFTPGFHISRVKDAYLCALKRTLSICLML